MIPGIVRIVSRSIVFYKKPVLYQILIIALIAAVITGSLLTGSSVRASLKKTSSERLGNTGILISSGERYFDPSLAQRMKDSIRINCTGILEITGFCQSVLSQKIVSNTHIYAVNQDFFSFQGNGSAIINPGEVAVNRKVADYLGVKTGDELIINFRGIDDIPSDAPFSPAKETGHSMVMKICSVLEQNNTGNFSLSISQIMPMNIFINLAEIVNITGEKTKMNRLLVENRADFTISGIYAILKNILKLSDIGLTLRRDIKTGEYELISNRIFIDDAIILEIQKVMPASAPVLTYLGNRLKSGTGSAPYSFVSALPSSLYPEIVRDDGIIINRWVADDLSANEGDTIEISWYSPDFLNKLIESSNSFVVKRIVDMLGIWSDSLLMPDFPGISGKASCSEWDAGVPVKMDQIRSKDEDYWNKYRGTPKAFINYEKGREIWGNNFGPATAIRFPAGESEENIEKKLTGSLDPYLTGFTVVDLFSESVRAASGSIDFSSLFLSLGFFLILASIVLLSFAVASYFDAKRGQIYLLFALGFKNRLIRQILFFESVLIALAGGLTGSLAGYFVNLLITRALNSVWKGAVQTDTLEAFFNPGPVLTGFIITILVTMVLMWVKVKRYLKKLNLKEKEIHTGYPAQKSFLLLLTSFLIFITLIALSIVFRNQAVALSFAAGTSLLITQVLFWRFYFAGPIIRKKNMRIRRKSLTRLYYSFYPSYAVTPILFIACGIFAVFITGANRMDFNPGHMKRSGGTGGYLLWCENSVPVREDLSSSSGKRAAGLDDISLKDIHFIQAKRSSGNDASCLNLNHITAPPLLGIDPAEFISRGSFSFARAISGGKKENPWHFLNMASQNNTIYGIADQTVLEWGLKIKTGDTIILRAENGQPLNIIIAAGLKSSVFQGYVLIGMKNFTRYYPSVSGSSILLVDGDPVLTDLYKSTLNERFENNGVNTELTTDRLAAFYEVTNTYLSVFGVFGALGMITGIAGLGFVLLKNYNKRKKEFALMLATGFKVRKIRRMILSEQVLILFAGITSGVTSAIVATLPSISNSTDIPWFFLIMMVSAIIIAGISSLFYSVRAITNDSLTSSLRRE